MKKWHLTSAQFDGVKHASVGERGEDWTFYADKNDVKIIVLADGSGSSKFAYEGAKITVESIGNLFINNFDELYNLQTPAELRRVITEEIYNQLLVYVEDHPELFENYIVEHQERFNRFAEQNKTDEFYVKELHATLLFVAIKDERKIIGHIGDGIIGGVIDNVLKIISEEEKTGSINQTVYPAEVYITAKGEPRTYEMITKYFKIFKSEKDITGFVLLSDGSDALVDSTVPFQKKFHYTVDTIFRDVVNAETQEEKDQISAHWAEQLTKKSNSFDDCSIAILVRDDYFFDLETGIEVKHYPRPVMEPKEEIKVVEPTPVVDAEEPKFESEVQANIDTIKNFDEKFVDNILEKENVFNQEIQEVISEYAKLIIDNSLLTKRRPYYPFLHYVMSGKLKFYLKLHSTKFL